MEKSNLGRLSAELRNEIYELTFAGCETVHILFFEYALGEGDFSLSPASQRDMHSLALLVTCRQVMEEARGIADSNVSFVNHADQNTAVLALRTFVDRVGEERVRVKPRLKIHFGAFLGGELGGEPVARLVKNLKALWAECRVHRLRNLLVGFRVPNGRSTGAHDLVLDFSNIEALQRSNDACSATVNGAKRAES